MDTRFKIVRDLINNAAALVEAIQDDRPAYTESLEEILRYLDIAYSRTLGVQGEMTND